MLEKYNFFDMAKEYTNLLCSELIWYYENIVLFDVLNSVKDKIL